MGNVMGSIEAEENELRKQERRNEILHGISRISDIHSEEGLGDVAIYGKRYAKTYRKAAKGEEGDDESAATG